MMGIYIFVCTIYSYIIDIIIYYIDWKYNRHTVNISIYWHFCFIFYRSSYMIPWAFIEFFSSGPSLPESAVMVVELGPAPLQLLVPDAPEFLPKRHWWNWLLEDLWVGWHWAKFIKKYHVFLQTQVLHTKPSLRLSIFPYILTSLPRESHYQGHDRDTITLYHTRWPANVRPKECHCKTGSTRQLRLPLPVGDKLLCTWTVLEGFCLRSSSKSSSSWCLTEWRA